MGVDQRRGLLIAECGEASLQRQRRRQPGRFAGRGARRVQNSVNGALPGVPMARFIEIGVDQGEQVGRGGRIRRRQLPDQGGHVVPLVLAPPVGARSRAESSRVCRVGPSRQKYRHHLNELPQQGAGAKGRCPGVTREINASSRLRTTIVTAT